MSLKDNLKEERDYCIAKECYTSPCQGIALY